MAAQTSSRPPRRTHRVRNWAIVLAVADLVVWVLTVRAHLDFHRSVGGPSTMTAGQALGWSFGVLLLIALIVLLYLARMDGHYRSRRPPASATPRLRR